MRCKVAHALMLVACLLLAPAALAGPIGPGSGTGELPQGPEEQADALAAAGRFGDAIKVLTDALAKAPDSARLHFRLARIYAQDQKFDLAKAELASVLKSEPDFYEAHLLLAQIAAQQVSATQAKAKNLELVNTAIQELRAAVKTNSRDANLYYQLARLLVNSTAFREEKSEVGFEEAMKVLDTAKQLAPKEPAPYAAMGDTEMAWADFVAAGKKLPDLPADVAKKVNGHLDAAKANYRSALDIEPRFLNGLNRIAAIESTRGTPKDAIKVLEDHLGKLESGSDKTIVYRWEAQYLVQAKDLAGAERKLDAAIKAEPKDMASYLMMAEVLAQPRPKEAIEVLEKALKINENCLNLYVQLGQLYQSQKNLVDAEKRYRDTLNIPPTLAAVVSPSGAAPAEMAGRLYADAAANLAEILIRKGQSDDAIDVFHKLAQLLPRSPIPEFQIGEVYRRINNPEAAKEHYENALRISKDFVPARASLAELTYSDVRFAPTAKERAAVIERSIEQYEMALEVAPENSQLLDRLASLRMSLAAQSEPQNKAVLEKALANEKKAIEISPDNPMYHFRLAQIQHELGKKEDAASELQKLISQMKEAIAKDPDTPETLNVMFQLAEVQSMLNKWQPDKALLQQSLDNFSAVVKKNPEYFQAYLQAGLMLEDLKDYKAAADWYKKLLDAAKGKTSAIALPPDRVPFALHAAAELSWIYCEYLPDLDQASAYAKTAMEINPNMPSLLDTVGWISYKKGDYPEAVTRLRSAYQGQPDNATIGYHLGAALIKNKNPEGAKTVLQESLKRVGSDAELKGKIEELLKDIK